MGSLNSTSAKIIKFSSESLFLKWIEKNGSMTNYLKSFYSSA